MGQVTVNPGTILVPGLNIQGDSDTGITGPAANTLGFVTGGAERLRISSTGAVFNEDSADLDFRIESNDNANVFGVDAALNNIGLLGAPVANLGVSVGNNGAITFTGTGADASDLAGLHIRFGGLTTVASHTGDISVAEIYGGTQTATDGTHAVGATLHLRGATKAGGGTITNGATLYISAAYSGAGTGNYAAWVDAGAIRLDGSLFVEASPTEGTAGEQLTSGGAGAVMTWDAAGCVAEAKEDIMLWQSPESALAQVLATPIYRFRYRSPEDRPGLPGMSDRETEYVGPMAHEAPWAMHYGGRILNPINAFGYTTLAMQALAQRLESLERKLPAPGL